MTRLSRLHQEWLKDHEYRKAYDALGKEFATATALIAARMQRRQPVEESADRD